MLVARRRTAAVRANMPNPPLGFLLLSAGVITVGLMACSVLTTAAMGPIDRSEVMAARAAGVLVTATAVLATEALWLVRRWVFAACAAFVVSLAVGWILMSVPLAPGDIASLARETGAIVAVWALPLLYVRRRSRRIFAPGAGGAGTP